MPAPFKAGHGIRAAYQSCERTTPVPPMRVVVVVVPKKLTG